MKPIIIMPEGVMDQANIDLLNANDICVVVAKEPQAVRFIDPLPAMSSRTQMESAAIQLCRKLLNGYGYSNNGYIQYQELCRLYTQLLTEGTVLGTGETEEERLAEIRRYEKEAEVRRLAREEAKAEREAAKAKAAQEREAKAAAKGK